MTFRYQPKSGFTFSRGYQFHFICRFVTENRCRAADRDEHIFWASAENHFDLAYKFFEKYDPIFTASTSSGDRYVSEAHHLCLARKKGSRRKTSSKIEVMMFHALTNWHGYMQDDCLHSHVSQALLIHGLSDIERIRGALQHEKKTRPEEHGLYLIDKFIERAEGAYAEEQPCASECYCI